MRRKFSKDAVQHIYQRSMHGFNLFYSTEDFLVFYTIVSIQARRYGITLLGMCLMIEHIHLLLSADSLCQMSGFISAYTSIYAKEFNARTGRKGELFKSAYGNAVKSEMKKIRSAIAYLFNNPVEKMLCSRAEEYRWNFLKYYRYGVSIKTEKCSRKLKRAMKAAEFSFRSGKHMKFQMLENILRSLDEAEREMFTDYVIRLYLPFDCKRTVGHYRSYEDMITAVNSNTGSEYEISERHYCRSDVPYREILRYLKMNGIHDAGAMISLPDEEKLQYMKSLKENTSASYTQIRKFLHIRPDMPKAPKRL